MQRKSIAIALYIVLIIICLFSWISTPIALLMGLLFSIIIGNPFPAFNSKAINILLQISIIGLGFGISLNQAIESGSKGLLFTVVSIFGTLTAGYFIGKWFNIDKKISYLISCGTAICGGSAIAAIAPVIKAGQDQISVALSTVFILNAVSLFIFPYVGNLLHLSQQQFGIWAAIAIHDTSSVVGAASKYGVDALQIATTIKLTRALWIIPIVFFSTLLFKSKNSKVSIPYFILLFFVAILLNSYLPNMNKIFSFFTVTAHKGIVVTLFLIGAALSKEALKSVGIKPFIQGVLLWVTISIVSLITIINTVS